MRKSALFNTPDERHAFVIGFSFALWFWNKLPMPNKYHNPLEGDYHYYAAGGCMAVVLLIAAIIYTIIRVTGG